MSKPEDHRRPPPRTGPPWYQYPPAEALKILAQDNRVEVASVTAALISQSIFYPLDTIKTQMQVYKFSSTLACATEIMRRDGKLALWSGMMMPIFSYCLVRGITFSWYQRGKYLIDEKALAWTGKSLLVDVNTKFQKPTVSSAVLFGAAGASSGLLASVIACPFELLKNARQMAGVVAATGGSNIDEKLSSQHRRQGSVKTAIEVSKRLGIRGLYSGFHLHALRDTIGYGIFFASYESLKQLLSVSRGNDAIPVAGAIAGGLCGVLSFACGYPIDSKKVKYQKDCLFSRTGGDKGAALSGVNYLSRASYQGLPVTVIRIFASNFLTMGIFELMKLYLRKLDVDPPQPPNRSRLRDPLDQID